MTEDIKGSPEQVTSLLSAMVKAQSRVERVKKGSTGQVGRQTYSYGNMDAVLEACDEALEENEIGISVFRNEFDAVQGVQWFKTYVYHSTGGYFAERGSMPLTPQQRTDRDGNPIGEPYYTAQGSGSVETYGRRYGYQSIFRLSAVDDDGKHGSEGNGAGARRGSAPARNPQTSPMATAAQEMGATPVTASAGNNSGSRPSDAATGASSRAPFTAKDLRGPVGATSFPSLGVVGAYLTNTPKNTAPTDEALIEFQEANPGVTMTALLKNAANWFVENGPEGEMKDRVLAWLGENE